jgi:ABC-type transport system substrate-binding protein
LEERNVQSQGSYWKRKTISRRAALRSALAAGGGLAALSLVGCGDDDDDDDAPSGGASPTAGSGGGSATPGAGGGGGSSQPVAGGRLIVQPTGYATTLVLVTTRNNSTAQLAGYTHSGLLQLKNGRPIVTGYDVTVEPDLAVALPEQPDELTYVFKLNPAKFHNGRDVVAEDVQWSLLRYAKDEDSAYLNIWNWLDTVEAPDNETVVVKTNAPYADAIGSLCGYSDGFIMAREHEESEAATTQLMGSGPFLFENTEAPVISRFTRNPNYFKAPLPYFDEVHHLGTADFAKRFADFSAGNVDVTYWHAAEERDQLAAARPDAHKFEWFYAGYNLIMRVDQEPFNDDRVRKALSMAIDRQALRDATGAGEGEDDQAFSWTIDTWGFRKPSELGEAAAYWEYNVAEAKKMLSAANLGSGFSTQMSHWDPSVIGQAYVDQAVLIQTQWANNLGIQVEDISQQFAPFFSGPLSGNYDGTHFTPGGGGVISAAPGIAFRNGIWSPPEGVTAPTSNTGHINDADLSAAADKQSTQLDLNERKETFKVMEEIMANQMYRLTTSTFTTTYFANEALQDCQMPITATNSALAGVKFWWFKE